MFGSFLVIPGQKIKRAFLVPGVEAYVKCSLPLRRNFYIKSVCIFIHAFIGNIEFLGT